MDMDNYIGRLLDNRYEIQEVIGTGGMAVVYKARCHRLNRLVAIKILKDEYCKDDEFRRRFHAESQAVAMLSHPNIVSVYDVSTSDDADYIVMELIDGITLKQYMEKKGVLNWKETLHFAIQIAKALEHAHGRGIVHRDIKPHNVMVLKNGSVKVADFGIARVMSKSNTLTKEALGSVHYISPEQAKGGRVDNRSDIYSLGVVMYEMMAGRPPFDGESPVAVAIQHINGGAAMPSTLNPNIPGGLEQIIMKAMAHDPADRYESATNMLYDMDEFRKEPSMLFDYNLPALDVVTRINAESAAAQAAAQPPKTTAERVAASGRVETGRVRQQERQTGRVAQSRNTSAARRDNESSRQAARRRAAERQAEETRSRIATIAIVICSLVAIMAIGIFLVTLFSDGLFGTQPEKLTVPTLIGQDYTKVQDQYPQFTFDIKKDYSSEYDKNVIMDQTPKAGDEVIRGTQIVITVSLGEKPREQIMDDLTGISQAEAEAFLANKQLNLQPLIKREAHATIPAGTVIRTEPAEGDPLVKGQTVTIFISSGPEVTEAKVPNVVGRNIETAIKIMNNNGFKNIEIENVDSDAPKDQVVRQSEDANQQIDVTTVIVLEVSNGPTEPSTEETVESTTDATEPDMVARKLNVTLPELTEEFTVAIKLDDQTLYEVTLQPGTTQLVYTVYGYGVRYYEIWINDIYHESMRIDFAVSESGLG